MGIQGCWEVLVPGSRDRGRQAQEKASYGGRSPPPTDPMQSAQNGRVSELCHGGALVRQDVVRDGRGTGKRTGWQAGKACS